MKNIFIICLTVLFLLACGDKGEGNNNDTNNNKPIDTNKKYSCVWSISDSMEYRYVVEYDNNDKVLVITDITIKKASPDYIDSMAESSKENVLPLQNIKGITTSVEISPEGNQVTQTVVVNLNELDFATLTAIPDVEWLSSMVDMAMNTTASFFRETLIDVMDYTCADN